jgi:predicted nucleic acid-binding protein
MGQLILPPDAIHAATALTKGNITLVTNDPGFKRVPGLSVVVLREILSS